MTVVQIGSPAGRERWEFEHAGRRFLALRHEGRWVVVDALCPHRQGRLADGVVRGDALVCPSHWYTFDLRSGRCGTTSDYRLGVYEVAGPDDALSVDIPEQIPRSWSDVLRSHARGVPPGRTAATDASPERA